MDNDNVISVSTFTDLPGARHRKDGDGSADEFFEDYVKPALDVCLNAKTDVVIDFDHTYGYASSFISQLAMKISTEYEHAYIDSHLILKSDDEPNLVDRFWNEYAKDYSG